MQIRSLAIPDVKVVTPRIFRDERGFFSETYSQRGLADAGIVSAFVQDNHALSVQPGVVRGLHFQIAPHAQGKLVRVVKGSIFDVAVDIRKGSPSFGKHVSAVLSAENWDQLWVPPGFAHGYATLEADTEVIYKVTEYYDPKSERAIRWNDPALGIAWPVKPGAAIVSAKDADNSPLAELPTFFTFQG